MMKSCTGKQLSIAISAVLVGSTAVVGTAGANPFGMTELSSGYMQLAEGKCGGKKAEGKCGEGKCGDSKSKGISVTEGKCGEGKCGSVQTRRKMDKDDDGMISKKEYIDWAVMRAEREFAMYDKNQDQVLSPDEVFERIRGGD